MANKWTVTLKKCCQYLNEDMANLNVHVKHNSCRLELFEVMNFELQCWLSSFMESMFGVIVVKALLISVLKWCVTFANFPFNSSWSYRVIAHFITSKCQPSSNDVRCCRLCLFQKTTACFPAGGAASESAVCSSLSLQKGQEREIRERQEW